MDAQDGGKISVQTRKTTSPRRYRLTTLAIVRRECARLYRLADNGLLDWRDATRGASILQILAGLIRESEIESRLAVLEERIQT